jgi:mono/diheme cytochrome c family protein
VIKARSVLRACLVLAVLAGPGKAQVRPPSRPPEVTDSAIAWGKALFHGSANCAACHGQGAWGSDYGPPLTGVLWLRGPGTYEWLIEQVNHGVPAAQSCTGEAMPMRGWTPMNDEEVKAVAAYVWSVSQAAHPPPRRLREPGD